MSAPQGAAAHGTDRQPRSGSHPSPGGAGEVRRANELAWAVWRQCAAEARRDDGQRSVSDWLAGRGIDPRAAWAAGFRFGLAPGPNRWHTVRPLLDAWGVPPQVSAAAGLVREGRNGARYDGFRHRVILPVHSPLLTGRRLLGFVGRTLDGDPDTPKYLNSPTNSLYRKSEVLFGLAEGIDRLRRPGGPAPCALVLCEGPLDAVNVSANGPWVGLAPCGTALTTRQAAWLTALADAHDLPVVLAHDGDAAGHDAAGRARGMLEAGLQGRLQVAELPAGADPGGMSADELRDSLGPITTGARR